MPAAKDVTALAGIFAVSGTLHLVRPEVYEPIMPDLVPRQREVIYASGVAELLCAAGLLHPRTRRLAGWASAALLLAVYPANSRWPPTPRGRGARGSRRSPSGGCRCSSR